MMAYTIGLSWRGSVDEPNLTRRAPVMASGPRSVYCLEVQS